MFQNTGARGHSEEVGRLMNLHSCWTPDPKALRSMDARDFMTWRSPCLVCGRALKRGAGIFGSNFLRKLKFSRPCLAAWCGECYVPHPEDPFPHPTWGTDPSVFSLPNCTQRSWEQFGGIKRMALYPTTIQLFLCSQPGFLSAS